jgi:hypothetical protein
LFTHQHEQDSGRSCRAQPCTQCREGCCRIYLVCHRRSNVFDCSELVLHVQEVQSRLSGERRQETTLSATLKIAKERVALLEADYNRKNDCVSLSQCLQVWMTRFEGSVACCHLKSISRARLSNWTLQERRGCSAACVDVCRRVGMTDNAVALYQNFQKNALKQHSCPLCTRKYVDENEFQSFISLVCFRVSTSFHTVRCKDTLPACPRSRLRPTSSSVLPCKSIKSLTHILLCVG